jgi:hypothetical protein
MSGGEKLEKKRLGGEEEEGPEILSMMRTVFTYLPISKKYKIIIAGHSEGSS